MKVIYDQSADIPTIIFTETPVAESDEDKSGVILDYDDKRNLISLEILDASRRVSMPSKIEYQVSPVAGVGSCGIGNHVPDLQLHRFHRTGSNARAHRRDTRRDQGAQPQPVRIRQPLASRGLGVYHRAGRGGHCAGMVRNPQRRVLGAMDSLPRAHDRRRDRPADALPLRHRRRLVTSG